MPLQAYAHPRRTTPRRSSLSKTHDAFPFPAPQRGIDVSQPLPGGNPMTAVRLENLIPRAYGCQMRKGYLRWVSNLDGEVRSFLPYYPATGTPELFAATSTGSIYAVTTAEPSSVVPVPVAAVPGGQPPGEWTSLNFVSSAGVHGLVAVNPGGGYWVYDGATFTHVTMGAGVGQIDGVDPDLFVHVTVYKNRLWFIEGGTTRAWYLPVGQFFGVATEFDFGAMMPMGGELAALVNWTMDGSSGVGINSQFVAIGAQGDVLVYSGDDPDEAATFRSIGRWYVGRVPVGRRFFSLYMADVIILSERGMCFLSELMRGQGFFTNVQTAAQINSVLAVEIANTLDTRYWEVAFLPLQQMVVINRAEVNVENLQWVYEVNNRAFATLRGIPMLTIVAFNGSIYTGDLSGNVWWAFEGNSDGSIDDEPGVDLQAVCVTSFQPLGDGVRVKRFLMVRPSFISDSPPGIQASLNSEWNLGVANNSPPYLGAGENFWDVGQWDVAVWSGEGRSFEAWIGAAGSGRYGSMALRLRASAGTVFVGWQALVEQGGIL